MGDYMGDYLSFVNKYSNKYNFDLQYADYLEINAYITNLINEILSFRGVKIDNKEALVNFTMCYLLAKHTSQEILENDYEYIVEEIVEKYYNKLNEAKPKEEQVPYPEKNLAVDYIYKDLKQYAHIFKADFNIAELAKNMRDSMNLDGFKDNDITSGKYDEIIIDYLSKGMLDVRFTEEFKNMQAAVTDQVVAIFNYKKKDTRYYVTKDSFEFMYYNNSTILNNVIFKITLAFIANNVNPRKLTSSAPEMEVIHNYIERDMIRVNSTRPKYKEESAIEKFKKLSREEQEEKIEHAKKVAIVFAIIFGLMAVENMIYNSIHNDNKKESKPNKNKYKIETNAYDLDRISIKVQNLRYNPEANEVIVPEDDIQYDIQNAEIDESIEVPERVEEDAMPNPEDLLLEMEGENVAKL